DGREAGAAEIHRGPRDVAADRVEDLPRAGGRVVGHLRLRVAVERADGPGWQLLERDFGGVGALAAIVRRGDDEVVLRVHRQTAEFDAVAGAAGDHGLRAARRRAVLDFVVGRRADGSPRRPGAARSGAHERQAAWRRDGVDVGDPDVLQT